MSTYRDIYRKYSDSSICGVGISGCRQETPFKISAIHWNTESDDRLRVYNAETRIVVAYRKREIAIAVPEIGSSLIYELNTDWGDVSSVHWVPIAKDENGIAEINRSAPGDYKKLDEEVDTELYDKLVKPWE